jgi:pyruvate dehydrogenase E1 component alpha subunit
MDTIQELTESRPSAASAASAASSEENTRLLRDYYRKMTLIRSFELRAAEMYTRAKIGGYCHLNLGEEATVVGLMAALRRTDYLFTTYRDHGYALARGAEPGRVMAELFGRTTGLSRGLGGSMHLFDVGLRMLGGYAIVGGQMPPATGAALAIAHRGEPGPDSEAVMCLLGDGTTNIGAFHESLNLAAVWHLPIVYVIVNNRLGMGTSVEAASGEPELYRRGCAYRIPGTRVDGNDVIAVRDAARAVLEQARSEHRPRILEAVSYRLRGHSVVDPAQYRSPEETQRLRAQDPLPAFRAYLIDHHILDAATADRLEEESERAVNAAVEFADASPPPDPKTLFDHVYATDVANVYRGLPGDTPIGSPAQAGTGGIRAQAGAGGRE